MPQPNAGLIDLLYDAMSKDIGIIVASEEPLVLRQKLYALRRQDALFEPMSFVLSPTNPAGELWLLKSRPMREDKPVEL